MRSEDVIFDCLSLMILKHLNEFIEQNTNCQKVIPEFDCLRNESVCLINDNIEKE